MKAMLILSQCMHLKSILSDMSYELRLITCMVMTLMVFSFFKALYFHCQSTQNVRKIRQLLENSRSQWRSGDLAGSHPVSPLPKIERVPACLALRRLSGSDSKLKITEKDQNGAHNSSTDSIRKMRTLQQDSPPSRSHIKVSTRERTETESRRRKNQIIPAEMLL
jgi:hypothetical protein